MVKKSFSCRQRHRHGTVERGREVLGDCRHERHRDGIAELPVSRHGVFWEDKGVREPLQACAFPRREPANLAIDQIQPRSRPNTAAFRGQRDALSERVVDAVSLPALAERPDLNRAVDRTRREGALRTENDVVAPDDEMLGL